MKRTMMVLFSGLAVLLTGCVVQQRCAPAPYAAVTTVYPAAPPPDMAYYTPWCGSTRFWYRVHHRLFDDGYSFNNDPLNHDSLAPVLGLDPYFPPAPLPYKSVD